MEYKNEIIALKAKVMLQKIDNLHNLYRMISRKEKNKESKDLEIIKKQYLQRYNELVKKEEYEKYKRIEDIITYEIAKIELQLDEYIYHTTQNYQEIIRDGIRKIRISSNYQDYQNIAESLNEVKTLEELLELYSPYIGKSEEEKTQNEISQLKFDVLYRKQVEDLIHQNENSNNHLKQYKNETEKEIFKRLLQEKVNSIKFETDTFGENGIEQILNDSKLLEKLIIIDMKSNPYEYINLLKAKVFNAHLCNIGNNPFEIEVYLTGEQLEQIGYGYMFSNLRELKTNKVNYSLLVAILKNIITDENVSLIECENLYRKFGFECNPIVINTSQACIKMIFNEVKESTDFKKLLQEFKEDKEKDRKSQEEGYCRIDFDGLVYKFNTLKDKKENLLKQILDKRETTAKVTRKRFFSPKHETSKEERQLQEIKEKGIITTDIDIIILLEKEIIEKNNEREIKEEENLEWLEELKNKKEQLKLEEIKKLLFIINDIYSELDINYNPREILPLENTTTGNSGQVHLAPIPEKSGNYRATVGHSFSRGPIYEEREYYRSDLRPLWEKYKKEFKELHMEVRKYSKCYESKPCFEICVNLRDIADLPIDYKKVKRLTKAEIEEEIEREEGEERK